MRITGSISQNAYNSQDTLTTQSLGNLLGKNPQMTNKIIRLFPQNSLTMFTEGLGQIYDIKSGKGNIQNIGSNSYKWKTKGENVLFTFFTTNPVVQVGTAGSSAGKTGKFKAEFTICVRDNVFNPYDVIKLENQDLLFVKSKAEYIADNIYRYVVETSGADDLKEYDLITDIGTGKKVGYNHNAHEEGSERGYFTSRHNVDEHIEYLTTIRTSMSWTGDAISNYYNVEDYAKINGSMAKANFVMEYAWKDALEHFYLSKEQQFIYGQTSMTPFGKCTKQTNDGRDIVEGNGIIAQMYDSSKQTYNTLNIELFQDILTDLSLRMPNKTGNEIMMTTGVHGYAAFQKMMEKEHRFFTANGDQYIKSKDGKVQLGAEYGSYTFGGNRVIVTVNNTFDNPNNVSTVDSMGRSNESQKMLFIDVTERDGVRNLSAVSKDGRSFVVGELDGIGGQDGKTSGKVATSVDGSSKHVIGQCGIVLHDPKSCYMLEKVNAL